MLKPQPSVSHQEIQRLSGPMESTKVPLAPVARKGNTTTFRGYFTHRDILRLLNNLSKRLLPNVLPNLPRRKRMSLLKDFLDFFQRSTDSFREHEKDVDEGREVKGSEYEVCLPRNGVESRRNGKGECGVKCPVRGLREMEESRSKHGVT